MENWKHLRIPVDEILLATNNFADVNLIGRGGFGRVYKGESEKHGIIAVKRLDRKYGQVDPEFFKEIAMLSEYKHENIVSLVGFCDEGGEKILVYKFESNGSLDKHLRSKDLTWIRRLRICIDAARGLKYLHDDAASNRRILHRDVKSSNILLDENWNAKISDFGLSKLRAQHTYLISNACGTVGYLDPMYWHTGILTKESDVYSFGVVLFEVLCGRPAYVAEYNDVRRSLAATAKRYYEEGKLDKIIDPDIRTQMNSDSLDAFSRIAYRCLNVERKNRPRMEEVIEQLQKALDTQLASSGSGAGVFSNFGDKTDDTIVDDLSDHPHQGLTIKQSRSKTSSHYFPATSTQLWKYDVYISFRGIGTLKIFVDNLYSTLLEQGIHPYNDQTFPRGEAVGPSLLTAIRESRIAVIVFSENYVNSSWCLEELACIMKCMDERKQIVIPIFYHVDPSDIRKQQGNYGEAFTKHELNNNKKKVESWRKALIAAANLSGWHPKQGHEAKFIEEIVDIISHRLPSSSSIVSIPASYSRWHNYDIFISFKGEHTCKTFADRIYSSLIQQGIHTYKPEETLVHGDLVGPSLLKAIEESRIAIIILSKNYATSSRCLDELAYIMKCVDKRGQTVIPIFYDVDPSDVQEQNGEFGKAFEKQELENMTKGESWREALMGVCDHSGWSLKHISDRHIGKYIKDIVDTISYRLNSNGKEDLIGMEPRLKGLKSTLAIGSVGVHMVGVLGTGGGGKTTLASSVYMAVSRQFKGRCFVENVRAESRKYGLKTLQQKILSTILKKEVEVPSDEEGRHMIKRMLGNISFLIVLDDVDDFDQLEALAGSHDWFGVGSRIIITSRDHNLLSSKVDVIYGVIMLSRDEAVQLLHRHAYGDYQLIEDYEMLSLELVSHIVSYIGGLPLALKILGAFLYGKNKNEWISFLAKLKEISNSSFIDMLKISYDGLQHEDKELFLDIACFFRHHPKDEAMVILDACYFHPRIQVLIRTSLISITDGLFDMHDIVQEMGHYIIRGEHPNNPEKRSRIWQEEDFRNICALDAMEENYMIQALHAPYYDAPSNLLKVVSNMKNLRLLNVRQRVSELVEEPLFVSNELRWISWENYPASSFPTSFQPPMLSGLILKNGLQKELWNGYKDLPSLKVLDLHCSNNLLRTPDFNGLPKLERLVLSCCRSLTDIDPSIGYHERLVYVNLDGCNKLKMFPDIVNMQKLETLILSRCSQLLKFPEIKQTMNGLQRLYMDYSGIEVVPSSIGQYCTNLVSISLIGCENLHSIEGNFHLLQQRCLILIDPQCHRELADDPLMYNDV